MLQLRDRDLAEHVVQETLLAALEGSARFAGKSSRKTWLIGILKHKIIDIMRRKLREHPLTSSGDESETEAIDAMFKNDGHWRQFPSNWGIPRRQNILGGIRIVLAIDAGAHRARLSLRECLEIKWFGRAQG
jgi:RNA polymerase sigma-70 factor (ECF subfamily)